MTRWNAQPAPPTSTEPWSLPNPTRYLSRYFPARPFLACSFLWSCRPPHRLCPRRSYCVTNSHSSDIRLVYCILGSYIGLTHIGLLVSISYGRTVHWKLKDRQELASGTRVDVYKHEDGGNPAQRPKNARSHRLVWPLLTPADSNPRGGV